MKLPVQDIIDKYKKNIYAAAYSICANKGDAEDVVQETLLQYYITDTDFESEDHIHAWLLRVAINKAKNVRSSFWNRNRTRVYR